MDRRSFIRGIGGAALSVPVFASANRLSAAAKTTALATTATGAPLRTVFVYFPNGAHQEHWFGGSTASQWTLGQTLQPLAGLRDSVQLIGGLDHLNATPGPDGAGDHARAGATFLTGVRARKTAGADIHLGRSFDQAIAERVGDLTRFASLEVSCDAVRKSGDCDSGYSCAYQYNLSWRSETQPMTPETNPRLLYERLFGMEKSSHGGELRLGRGDQSNLLDFVLEDANDLRRTLGRDDVRKMDEYLSSVRDIEQRLRKADRFAVPPRPDMTIPDDVPPAYDRHIDLMFDLVTLALQTDATRVATLLLAADGSNRAFPEIDIPEGHHWLTHQAQETEREKVALIDRFYAERFARFLTRLGDAKDVDGNSLLHNSMIVYGSGIGDGNRHNHDNLPILLAGNGGGTMRAGRFVQAGSQPMSNLYVGMAQRLGIDDLESFGDSSGVFDGF